MKDFMKVFFLLLAASSAFLIGYYLGEEKEKAKFPNFQEDLEPKS